MAVKYVSDFEFPSDFGFHKPSSQSGKGIAKGMNGFSKSKAGPSVVTGGTKGHGGGKLQHGAVPKFSHGGLAKGAGVGKGGSEDRGIGKTAEHFSKISDKRSPAATRTEKSSGVQKPAFKKGGSTTPMRYKAGGDTLHESGCKCSYCGGGKAMKEGGTVKVAAGKVKDGTKTPWNKDDGVSPGSFKRTPPGEKVTNKKAANSKFDAEGRDTEPATKQSGNVERMSEFSDFKKGGHAKKKHHYAKGGQVKTEDRYETGPKGQHITAPDKQERGDGMEYKHGGSVHPKLKNLGKYAHSKGGAVHATRSEVSSGTAGSSKVNIAPGGQNSEYEHDAGTPGVESGDNYEMKSGEPHMAMGGLSRSANPKKMAAIHAKKDHAALGQLAGVVGALSQAPKQPAAPGMGQAPPGMAPPMGAPPGMAGGAPRMPPMAAEGGSTMHIVHHHINHG